MKKVVAVQEAKKHLLKVRFPKCYCCGVSVTHELKYEVKQLRAVQAFLTLNPQWLTFGKAFDDTSILCNQPVCLAAAFENFRIDTFGIKSPRSPRMKSRSRSPQKATPARPAFLDEQEQQEHEIEEQRPLGTDRTNEKKEDQNALTEIQNFPDNAAHSNRVESLSPAGEHDDAFYKAIESRRNQLAFLQSKGSTLHAAEGDLTQKLMNNRDERLRIAQRLRELRDKQPEIELAKQERQKQLIIERKRELYRQLVAARMEHNIAANKIERFDMEQKLALMKLDILIDAKNDEEAVTRDLEKFQQLQESVEPTLQHLTHVPQAKDILEKGLKTAQENKDYEQQSTAITQELQTALREAYTKGKEDLLVERGKLTAGRFELEERMGQLKDLNFGADTAEDDDRSDVDPNDRLEAEGSRRDDEPFDAAYELAERMDSIVQKNLEVLSERILKAADEKKWLDTEPRNDEWQQIVERVNRFKTDESAIKDINQQLVNYLETSEEHEKYMSQEKDSHVRDIAIMGCTNDIISEVYKEWIAEFISYFCVLARDCATMLDQAVLDVICGNTPTEKEFLRATGREYLLRGILQNLRRKNYDEQCHAENLSHANYTVDISQANCINSNYLRDSGMNYSNQQYAKRLEDWKLPTDKRVSLCDFMERGLLVDDKIRRTPVVLAENIHWSKISLQTSRAAPLVLPNITGRIELIRCFPRAYTHSTIVIAAVHHGVFGVWTVPWTGGAPLLVSVSPALERKNRCDILDIREGSINSQAICCLYRNGHVRVWDLNPVSNLGRRKGKNHSWNLFPDNVAHFVPTVPSCIYHLNPLDLSLPLELGEDGLPISTENAVKLADKNKEKNAGRKRAIAEAAINNPFAGGAQLGKTAASEHQLEEGFLGTRKSKIQAQPGTHPVTVCFHPAFTITGRNPSIMVGSEGGAIVKFNMDFRINDLDVALAYLPPFVDVEYVLPQNAPDVILAAGKPRKGNRVYRELFHYHRSAIIYMGVVGKVSDRLVSVDDQGHLAIWEYSHDRFKGMCWYEPIHTVQLNVDWRVYNFLGKTTEEEQAPTPEQLTLLKCRSRSHVKQMVVPPRHRRSSDTSSDKTIQKVEMEFLQEIYHPIVGNGSRLIEFTSLLPLKQKKNDRNSNIFKESSTRSGLQKTPETPWHNVEPPPDIKWTSQVVKEVVSQTVMEHVAMSDDGSELFFCLSYRVDNRLGKNTANQQPYTECILIAGLWLETLEFRPPYPQLELKPGELLRSMSIGPIASETLTRVAFVHLNTCTKVFSLETGQEIITGTFPLKTNLASYDPFLMSVCPSQRVIAYASPQDTRVDVKIFIHADDGKESEVVKEQSLITPEVLKGLRLSVAELEKLSVKSVMTTEVPPDFEYELAKLEVDRFIAYVWNAFEIALDRKQSHDERERLITAVYSATDQLGVIKPVFWPPDYERAERKSRLALNISRKNEEIEAMRTEKEQPVDSAVKPPASPRDRFFTTMSSLPAYLSDDWHTMPPSGMPPYSKWDGISHYSLAKPEVFEGLLSRVESVSELESDEEEEYSDTDALTEPNSNGIKAKASGKTGMFSPRLAGVMRILGKKYKKKSAPRPGDGNSPLPKNSSVPSSPMRGENTLAVSSPLIAEMVPTITSDPASANVLVTAIAAQEPEAALMRRLSMSPRAKLFAAAALAGTKK